MRAYRFLIVGCLLAIGNAESESPTAGATLGSPRPLTAVVAFPNLVFNRPLFLTSAPDGTNRLLVRPCKAAG